MKQKSKEKLSGMITIDEIDDFFLKVYDGEITDVDPALVNSIKSVFENEHISQNLYFKCRDLVDLIEEDEPSGDSPFSADYFKQGIEKVGALYRIGLEIFEAASKFNNYIRERYPAEVIESGFRLED